MAESMVSIVIAIALIAMGAVLLSHQMRREHHRHRSVGHFDGRRLWERMRHRH
ncbi:MAG TPA: hypothetical protein VNE00_21010 [Paraburkholderia sp.]|jgi:hypothetical protein|nr:hypothetical protein [Paraburkholderia sp.]